MPTPSRLKRLSKILLLVYLPTLVWVLFFFSSPQTQLIPNRHDFLAKRDIHLQPFFMISHYIEKCARQEAGTEELVEFAVNVFGNMLLFLPFGVLLPLFFWGKCNCRWYHLILITLSLSLLTEILQISFRVGNFDIDDVMLNTFGGILGYLAFKILLFFSTKQVEPPLPKAD